MGSVWYCCECNFGPHNSDLYEACIDCGVRRCGCCTEQKTDDSLLLCAHSHSHGVSPLPSAVFLDTAHNLSLNSKSLPVALPDLAGIRPLSQLNSATTQAQYSPLGGQAHVFSHTSMYICCQCQDGPKVWDHEPKCVSCNHEACSNCTHIK